VEIKGPFEQVGEQDDGITLWAVASQTDATSKGVALGTPLLAEGACFAGRALVHAVFEEPPLALEFGSKMWQVQRSWSLMAQSIRVLLAGSCAIALLGWAQRRSTDQAHRRRTRRV